MKKLLIITSAAAAVLLMSACNSRQDVENFVTFHICEPKAPESASRTRVTMPISHFEVMATDALFLSQGDLDNVSVAEVEMPDGQKIRGLYFTFNADGTKKLYRETATYRNGWILMKEKNLPVGLRKIDTIIQDGRLFMLVEFPPETDLFAKAQEYNEGIKIIREAVERKKSSWNIW